jgi:ArsR family transcriptional regulator
MDTANALTALAALAQETRLAVFRLLVETGPEGLSVGKIAERLGVAGATLSFHLKEMMHADLVTMRHEGRYVYCVANFATMDSLLAYLTENCCGGMSTYTPMCEPNLCQSQPFPEKETL